MKSSQDVVKHQSQYEEERGKVWKAILPRRYQTWCSCSSNVSTARTHFPIIQLYRYTHTHVLTSPGVKIDPSDVHSLVFGSAHELYLVWKVW